MRPALRKEDREAFRRDALRMADGKLAAKWGFSETTARRWRKRLCPDRPNLTKHPWFDRAKIVRGVKSLWGTKSKDEIATELGCCRQTVESIAREEELPKLRRRSTKTLSLQEEEAFAKLARQATGWGSGRRGPTVRELAKMFGLGVRAATRLRIKLGIVAEMPQRTNNRKPRATGEVRREAEARQRRVEYYSNLGATWRCGECGAVVREKLACPQGHHAPFLQGRTR